MLAKLNTFSLLGINAVPVEVEVDVAASNKPATVLVGLPEAAVRESTHRVERAMANSGFKRCYDRIVINLAPAELPKQAASFDLPITLGMLASTEQLDSDILKDYAVVGELSLEGHTRPTKGALAMAMHAAKLGYKGIMVPAQSGEEAAVVEDIEVIPVRTLAEAVGFFDGGLEIPARPSPVAELFAKFSHYDIDYSDVRGQEVAKRAIMIAAAGAHNLLMLGPPGSGKTMLAKRVPTVLPPLLPAESIETSQIYSALGRLDPGRPLLTRRPFRSPHHTISDAGLVGGGSTPVPGEISMSHNGVLFLDELPEFNRRTLEVLRQPLEDGVVTISRALTSTTFPASLMLIAALNPCPCGFRSDPRRNCQCNDIQVERYMGKISGPLLDRIDIHIEVPAVPFKELSSDRSGTSSATIRDEVIRVRQIQGQRFSRSATRFNSKMSSREIRTHCKLDEEGRKVLADSVNEMGLSARAHDKVLRTARTIADLENEHEIQVPHLQEALNYRTLDRDKWD